MVPFYGWGSIVWKLKSHGGDRLLSTTKSPGVPGTHFINLRRIKDWLTLEPLSGFEPRTPGLGIQRLKH